MVLFYMFKQSNHSTLSTWGSLHIHLGPQGTLLAAIFEPVVDKCEYLCAYIAYLVFTLHLVFYSNTFLPSTNNPTFYTHAYFPNLCREMASSLVKLILLLKHAYFTKSLTSHPLILIDRCQNRRT